MSVDVDTVLGCAWSVSCVARGVGLGDARLFASVKLAS